MSILVLNPFSDVIGIVIELVAGIYHFAAWIFEVFLILASGQLIDSDKYSLVIQNFYIVLGIVLLFYLSFSLLSGMVNPDDQKKGTTVVKNSIVNLITSAIILAVLPYIFGFMYDFQTSFILRYNVIGRFFGYGSLDTPSSANTDTLFCTIGGGSDLIKQGAFRITNGVFTAFFNVNEDWCSKNNIEVTDNASLVACQQKIVDKDELFFVTWTPPRAENLFQTIKNVDNSGLFSRYLTYAPNVRNGEIQFTWLLAIIAGIILIYVAVSYCFDMAIRMVRLVFYQIIAPIPIFSRVLPDGPLKGSFDKWVKIVVACYLEVYIRIFVFYLAIYLCMALIDNQYIDNILACFSPLLYLLTKAFLLMGIIMFMRQAPKLISDVTGLDAGGMKLGIMDKLRDGGFFTAGAALGSAVTAGVRNFTNARKNGENGWRTAGSTVGGAFSGFFRGGHAGWKAGNFSEMASAAGKGAKGVTDARDKRAAYRASHPEGVIQGHINDAFDTIERWAGINNIQALQEEKSGIQKVTKAMDSVTDATKNMLRNEINGKGKNWSFGLDATSPEGIGKIVDARYGGTFDYAFSAENYRKLSDALDRAKTSGKEVTFNGRDYTADQLQRMFGKYESDYSKALANQLLKSDDDYRGLISDIERKYTRPDGTIDRAKYLDEVALLNSQRGVAQAFKHELERALGSGLVNIANEQAAQIDSSGTQITSETVQGSIRINEGALDRIGAASKQRIGEIDAEVSKIQQKEADKNGK